MHICLEVCLTYFCGPKTTKKVKTKLQYDTLFKMFRQILFYGSNENKLDLLEERKRKSIFPLCLTIGDSFLMN